MTNNDELALKARIERALEDFTNGRACMHVPPLDTDVDLVLGDCLALLAERDADKKLIALNTEMFRNADRDIAALRQRIAELEALTAEQDKRLITYAAIAKKNASEARTVSVKLPKRKSAEDYVDENFNNSDLAAVYNACRWQCQVKIMDACDEAGIKLEVGE